nr:MAG TPA: hypothetical protein [Caudoviricetes sp.]
MRYNLSTDWWQSSLFILISPISKLPLFVTLKGYFYTSKTSDYVLQKTTGGK